MNIRYTIFPLLAFGSVFLYACNEQHPQPITADQKVNLANTFYNNELFDAAIREYQDYLQNYQVDDQKRANIYYTIANIYFERLFDYNKALEYFYRVKFLYPDSPLQSDIGKKIVSCLERLQRSQDAERILQKETALKPDETPEHKTGEVVAQVGDQQITQGDLDFEINLLPPYLQSQLKSREQKLEYLQQIVAEQLLYDSAKREGLENDKDIIEGTFRAKKKLMAQRILNDQLAKKINIQPADVELYYKANKEKYVEKDDKGKVVRQKEFSEVARQVAQDLMLERQEKAYRELLNQLMTAQNVQIFEKRIR
jgi:tetratricopeptide (TPR) repeat protein